MEALDSYLSTYRNLMSTYIVTPFREVIKTIGPTWSTFSKASSQLAAQAFTLSLPNRDQIVTLPAGWRGPFALVRALWAASRQPKGRSGYP